MKPYKTAAILVLVCVMIMSAGRTDAGAETVTAKDEENIVFDLEDGVLTISGKGDIPKCKHKKIKWSEAEVYTECEYDGESWWPWSGYWCYEDKIKSVVIEEGITSIPAHAFSHSFPNAQTLVIPSSVKSIGHAAFEETGFRHVIMGDGVTSLGVAAFNECYHLESVQLSKNIKKIEKKTFSHCYSLKQITIPEKVKIIGEGAFDSCEKLEVVNWEEKSRLKEIGLEAFLECEALRQITFPETLQTIGKRAFAKCSKLEKATWEEKSTLKTIKQNAFAECNIKKLTIPASVTNIEDGSAVNGGIQKICVEKGNPKYKSRGGVLFSKNGKTLVSYPCKKKDSTYKIPKGVKTIGAYAFSAGDYYKANTYLKKVIMPDSVKTVKKCAFFCVKKLKEVRLSRKLKRVEQQAFSYCALISLKLPDSLVYIGERAFDCEKIKGTIVIPKNVKEIDTVAFPDSYNVKKIVIKSKKLKKVGKQVFGRNKIIKVVLPKSKQAAYEKFFTKKRQGKNIQFVYK